MKPCIHCGETKPLDEFYAHAQMLDGHLNKCKDCTKAYVRRHRAENIERVREYDRSRAARPENVARRARVTSEYRAKNPDRYKAHSAVSNAVRDGRLKKLPCAFCGSGETEAHHHDYSKPLDVTWLCKPCHHKFHGLERMATYRNEEAA